MSGGLGIGGGMRARSGQVEGIDGMEGVKASLPSGSMWIVRCRVRYVGCIGREVGMEAREVIGGVM